MRIAVPHSGTIERWESSPVDSVKIVAINLGSTSTKIAYFVDGSITINESISHDPAQLVGFRDIWDQYDLRKATIDDFLARHHISLDELSAFCSRGGHTEPIEGGTYRINEAMLAQNRSGLHGIHVGNVGLQLAYEYSRHSEKIVPITCYLPSTDEFEPIARISGLPELPRESRFQALNHKAMARHYAESIGRNYEDLDLVVVMLGGGISVASHRHGRMIDGPDALAGEGPFSNNRCGTVPIGSLVKLCYSGKYTLSEMLHHINGEGGLVSYLGTTDIRAVESRAKAGDETADLILKAMCYQTAKEIGAQATVLYGHVDAILLTGGMANSSYITEEIKKRVSYIAPVVVLPGEREMECLCMSAYRALTGQETLREFIPKESQ